MFFEDNFEHFNLTGSAEPSTDDFCYVSENGILLTKQELVYFMTH